MSGLADIQSILTSENHSLERTGGCPVTSAQASVAEFIVTAIVPFFGSSFPEYVVSTGAFVFCCFSEKNLDDDGFCWSRVDLHGRCRLLLLLSKVPCLFGPCFCCGRSLVLSVSDHKYHFLLPPRFFFSLALSHFSVLCSASASAHGTVLPPPPPPPPHPPTPAICEFNCLREAWRFCLLATSFEFQHQQSRWKNDPKSIVQKVSPSAASSFR